MKKCSILYFTILLLILPQVLTAGGTRENLKAYRDDREDLFLSLLEGEETADINLRQGISDLADLRGKYKVVYTDEEGVAESILDRAAGGSLSRQDALFYFELLQDGTLMDYRREEYRARTEQHRILLVGLLTEKMDQVRSGEETPEGLRLAVNNYYEMMGMEFDQDYASLSRLIQNMEKGEVSVDEFLTHLGEMGSLLARNQADKSGEQERLSATGSNSTAKTPGSGKTPPEDSTPGPSAPPSSPPGSPGGGGPKSDRR